MRFCRTLVIQEEGIKAKRQEAKSFEFDFVPRGSEPTIE
jgi:hypothetical protein